MRKRSKEIIFRMTPDENYLFERKVEESGLSKQKYLLGIALEKAMPTTGKELEALTELNKKIGSLLNTNSRILKNLDEMTMYCATFGEVTQKEEIVKLIKELKEYQKEGMEQWELLRSFNAAQSRALD